MALTLNPSAGGDFKVLPAGNYPGRLVEIIDMGTQPETYEGVTKNAKKVRLGWEICDVDERRDDGKPFVVRRKFTASLHERSGLTKVLKAWGVYKDGEPLNFASLIGKPCMLAVSHTVEGDQTYVRIETVAPVPKGMAVIEAETEPIVFDLDAPDADILAGFNEKFAEVIKSSPEYKASLPSGLI